MKIKILTAIAIAAATGLILWGCAGSSQFIESQNVQEWEGNSVPVTITTSAGSNASQLVQKDITIGGAFDSEGGGYTPDQSAYMKDCNFTWLNVTNSGNTPVIELVSGMGFAQTDCAAAGKSPYNCLACMNIITTIDIPDGVGGTIVSAPKCTLYCEGWLPNIPASNSDFLVAFAHLTPEFTISGADPDKAVIVEYGTRSFEGIGWDELDTLNLPGEASPMMDLILNNAYVSESSGYGWDLDKVNGDGNEWTLSAAPDVSDEVDAYAQYTSRSWTKYLDISAVGTDPIEFTRQVEVLIEFSGVTYGMTTFMRDDVILSYQFLDDRSLPSGLVEAYASPSSMMALKDLDENFLIESPALTDISMITVEYYYPAYITQTTPLNIALLEVTPVPLLDQPDTLLIIDDDPANVANLSFHKGNQYLHQMREFYVMVRDQIQEINGVTTMQDEPIYMKIKAKCAINDEHFVEETLDKCYDIAYGPIANDQYAPTITSMNGVKNILSHTIDANKNVMVVDGTNFTANQKDVIALTKLDVVRSGEPDTATMVISDIDPSTIDDVNAQWDNDAILIRSIDSTGLAMVLGVEALTDANLVDKMHCVYYIYNGSTSTVLSGGKADCSAASSITLTLTVGGQTPLVFSFDDGNGVQSFVDTNPNVTLYPGAAQINPVGFMFNDSPELQIVFVNSSVGAQDMSLEIDKWLFQGFFDINNAYMPQP